MPLVSWLVLSYNMLAHATAPLNNTASAIPLLQVDGFPSNCHNTKSSRSIIASCFVTLFACTWTAEERTFATDLRRLCLMLVALIAPELVIAWALRQSLAARDIERDCRSYRWPVNLQMTDKLDRVMLGHLDEDTEKDCGGDIVIVELLHDVQQEQGKGNRMSEGHLESSLQLEDWALTHGFFGWMGGFLLYVNHTPRGPLKASRLISFFIVFAVDMSTCPPL
ncbi:hypothetical protein EDB19DRAFT_1824460 [Suillus lakei]|nr:hypothetical protein EDB19DRAFT_1824460 [Suillus lakei]